MTTSLLHSLRQGAYIAIALYVVLIAVVTLTSMSPSITASQDTAVVHSASAVQPVAHHAS